MFSPPHFKTGFLFLKKTSLNVNPKKKKFFFPLRNIFMTQRPKSLSNFKNNKFSNKLTVRKSKFRRYNKIREIPTVIIFKIAAGFGFLETFYLTFSKFNNFSVLCDESSCLNVLSSTFSDLLGFPVSLFGLSIYFLFFFELVKRNFFEQNHNTENLKKINFMFDIVLFVYGIAGIYFSLILEKILKARCQWCSLSILLTSVIFLSLFYKQNEAKGDFGIFQMVALLILMIALYAGDVIEIYLSLFLGKQ